MTSYYPPQQQQEWHNPLEGFDADPTQPQPYSGRQRAMTEIFQRIGSSRLLSAASNAAENIMANVRSDDMGSDGGLGSEMSLRHAPMSRIAEESTPLGRLPAPLSRMNSLMEAAAGSRGQTAVAAMMAARMASRARLAPSGRIAQSVDGDGPRAAMTEALGGSELGYPASADPRPGTGSPLRVGNRSFRSRPALSTDGIEGIRAFFELAERHRDNAVAEARAEQMQRHESRKRMVAARTREDAERTRASLETYQRVVRAVVRVQARWRGYVARKRAERARMQQEMAKLLQENEAELAKELEVIVKQDKEREKQRKEERYKKILQRQVSGSSEYIRHLARMHTANGQVKVEAAARLAQEVLLAERSQASVGPVKSVLLGEDLGLEGSEEALAQRTSGGSPTALHAQARALEFSNNNEDSNFRPPEGPPLAASASLPAIAGGTSHAIGTPTPAERLVAKMQKRQLAISRNAAQSGGYFAIEDPGLGAEEGVGQMGAVTSMSTSLSPKRGGRVAVRTGRAWLGAEASAASAASAPALRAGAGSPIAGWGGGVGAGAAIVLPPLVGVEGSHTGKRREVRAHQAGLPVTVGEAEGGVEGEGAGAGVESAGVVAEARSSARAVSRERGVRVSLEGVRVAESGGVGAGVRVAGSGGEEGAESGAEAVRRRMRGFTVPGGYMVEGVATGVVKGRGGSAGGGAGGATGVVRESGDDGLGAWGDESGVESGAAMGWGSQGVGGGNTGGSAGASASGGGGGNADGNAPAALPSLRSRRGLAKTVSVSREVSLESVPVAEVSSNALPAVFKRRNSVRQLGPAGAGLFAGGGGGAMGAAAGVAGGVAVRGEGGTAVGVAGVRGDGGGAVAVPVGFAQFGLGEDVVQAHVRAGDKGSRAQGAAMGGGVGVGVGGRPLSPSAVLGRTSPGGEAATEGTGQGAVLVRAMSPARSPEALAEKTIAKATAQGGEETGRGNGGGGRGTGVRKDRDPSSAPHHIRKPPRGTLLPLTAGPVHGKDLSVDTLTAQAALRLQKT